MLLTRALTSFIDRYYIVVMLAIAPVVICFNWYGQGMSGLLPLYHEYALIIKNTFQGSDLLTFPMWGYGWLMLITENKLALLCIQMGLALVCLYYFIQVLERSKIYSYEVIRAFKVCMMISLPWYAFHALRWPYSIASSLFLLTFMWFYKAVSNVSYQWKYLIGSAICFGLLLHFRSDYWLMPLGFAFLLIMFFRTKKVCLQALVWLIVLYSCLLPWAIYTKKACGHYLLTSTNSGHVMFIGLGSDPDNRWGIESHDGDPLMHRLVDEHFNVHKHSTLNYKADQFLKKTFFAYVKAHPWAYCKKVMYTFYVFATEGFYSGEFFLNPQGETPLLKNNRLRFLVLNILTHPHLLITDFYQSIKIVLGTCSYILGMIILLLSYIFLPITLYLGVYKKRSFFVLLIIATIAYQTMLNCCCFHMPSYTSNLYVLYVLNSVYGILALYETVIKNKKPLF